MRRALVVTDESARHPFRMSLPPHVRRLIVDENRSAAEAKPWRFNLEDVKLFLMAYCACFMAVSTWIS
ncbi:MAG: hypothetical protein ACKOPO_14700 [Novosphingobium sp.]